MAETKKVLAGTKILPCNCNTGSATEYQDKEYGLNMRVHNYSKLSKSLRCTCCLKEKDIK